MNIELPILERLRSAAKQVNQFDSLDHPFAGQTNAQLDELILVDAIAKLQRCGFLPAEAVGKVAT